MKIVLISPKGPLYRKRGGVFKKALRYQPLTLTTLAALIPRELHADVELFDEGVQDIPRDLAADLVGLTVITGTSCRAYELAAEFRQRKIPVVLGGPHVTLLPDEAQQHGDAICVGYAEETWPELLHDFSSGKMQKTYFQRHDMTFSGNMPFARRELFAKGDFLTQAVFEATRSCTHHCDFCVAPTAWGSRQYQKPIDWVIEDIRQFGQRTIIFVDLNLISDEAYAMELFRRLIPMNVHWFGLSTVLLHHNQDMMELMARSGCKGLLLGFETISGDGLGDVKKTFNSSVVYQKLINDLHHLGIAVQGCFVFGLDHDRNDVFDSTAEFAIEAGIDLPRFALLTPFPGTPLYQRLEAEERITSRDWRYYDGQHVVFKPLHMTSQQLAEGHEKAWRKVYRWRSIGQRLWKARNSSCLAFSANLGYRYYAHHLHRYYNCDWPIAPVASRTVSGQQERAGAGIDSPLQSG